MAQTIPLKLTTAQFRNLNAKYRDRNHNKTIGNRAIELVKIHFENILPDCEFEVEKDDADLIVRSSKFRKPRYIEVKGTTRLDIAFGQLKVSGDPSYKMLTKNKIPVYRVTGVFERSPTIWILQYGKDFGLKREPRWRFEKIGKKKIGGAKAKRLPAGRRMATRNSTRGSKYEALTRYLSQNGGREVYLKFSDAKKSLGFELPNSAKLHQAFWANQTNVTNRPQAKAWQEAGYYVDETKLSKVGGWVRFKRR